MAPSPATTTADVHTAALHEVSRGMKANYRGVVTGFAVVLTSLLPAAPSLAAGTPGGFLDIHTVATGMRSGMPSQFKFTGEYVVFDASTAKRRSDGSVAIDQSMAEFAIVGTPSPTWTVDPATSSKSISGRIAIGFDRPFKSVPDRVAAVTLKVEFTQSIHDREGKWHSMPREVTFPITVPEAGASRLSRCVAITGQPNGGIKIEIHDECPPPPQP